MNSYLFFFNMPDKKYYWMYAKNIGVIERIPGATNIENFEEGKQYNGAMDFCSRFDVIKDCSGKYIVVSINK